MDEERVKLHGNVLSPFVLRAEWALKLKGIEYEYIHEDLFNKSPQLLQYNHVHKMVPVLVHGGKPIAESVVIVEYIDEAWKENYTILPTDPYERALARFWAKFAEEKCLYGGFGVFSKTGEEQQISVKELQENLKTLEQCLEGKKFFGGEAVGFVDIVAGWIPSWLRIIEEIIGITIVDEEHLPLINAWTHDFLDLDLVKESMPPIDKVKDRMRTIRRNLVSPLSV